jgi:hypothetical protein
MGMGRAADGAEGTEDVESAVSAADRGEHRQAAPAPSVMWASSDVRYWRQSGHYSDTLRCLLLTQTGHSVGSAPNAFQCVSLNPYDALS